MAIQSSQGKFCARNSCSIKLVRGLDESVEEFEVRVLCHRCERELASMCESERRRQMGDGEKRTKALKFGGARD
jgi:hypothetical protein